MPFATCKAPVVDMRKACCLNSTLYDQEKGCFAFVVIAVCACVTCCLGPCGRGVHGNHHAGHLALALVPIALLALVDLQPI
jgi:hypothetical protein